jgi:hypothetical protein
VNTRRQHILLQPSIAAVSYSSTSSIVYIVRLARQQCV